MSKTLTTTALLLVIIIGIPFLFGKCGPAPVINGKSPILNMCFCRDSTKKDSLCSHIPHNIAVLDSLFQGKGGGGTLGYSASFDSIHQQFFDIFSWQSFVALNWPADAKGNPVPNAFMTDTKSPRVWEMYPDPDTVFRNTSLLGASRQVFREQAKKEHRKFLFLTSKLNPMSGLFEADGHALIDQNLNYATFEVRISPDEYKYIVQNDLRTQAGQEAYVDTGNFISLPEGHYTGKAGDNGMVGEIEVKASWKILMAGKDSFNRYYHEPALIAIDSAHSTTGQAFTFPAEVGLVGLHIVHKTSQAFGQMAVWTTFEHIDNVPDNLQNEQDRATQKQYSFYDPNCIGCPVNAPPQPAAGQANVKWSPTLPNAQTSATIVRGEAGRKGGYGTQVVRQYPIYYVTQEINKIWRNKVQGTCWENYQLIGSQWAGFGDTYPRDTTVAPQFLGNSTMETYMQADASCISCHKVATIAGHKPPSAQQYKSDFSFLFHHATVKTPPVSEAMKPEKPEVK